MPHDMVHAMTPVAQGGAVDVGHTTLLTDMEESTEGGDEAVLRLRLGEPSQEFLCPTTRDSIWSLTHFPGGAAAAGAGGADDYVFQVRVAKEGNQASMTLSGLYSVRNTTDDTLFVRVAGSHTTSNANTLAIASGSTSGLPPTLGPRGTLELTHGPSGDSAQLAAVAALPAHSWLTRKYGM